MSTPHPVPGDLREALTEALVALCEPSIGHLYREDRQEWNHYLTEWPHAPGFLGGVVVPQAVTNIVDAVLPVVEAWEAAAVKRGAVHALRAAAADDETGWALRSWLIARARAIESGQVSL